MEDMTNTETSTADAVDPENKWGTERTTEKPRGRYKLSRGWVKQQLCTELAKGEATLQELADKYGVAVSSMHEFKTRNIVTIEALREDIQNEMAGLWIAEKKARVAEYQADVDLINDALEEIDPVQLIVPARRGETLPFPELLTGKHRALKSVAEELGHLPNRVTLNGEVSTTVNYTVDGVNMEDLM